LTFDCFGDEQGCVELGPFVVKQGLFVGLCLSRLFCRLLLLLRLLRQLLLVLVPVLALVRQLLLLSAWIVVAAVAAVAAVVADAVDSVDILEYHYCIQSCLCGCCIFAAPVRMGSSGPLPGIEYTEEVRGPFEIVQDGTGGRVNKSEYRHRGPHQKLKAVPTFYYSTLSNST
jgi:hypothetical protein